MRTRGRRVRNPGPASPPHSTGSVPGGGPTLVAGYRALRRLASTDRADLYVGVAPSPSTSTGDEARGWEQGGSTTSVVLKVFHPGTDDFSIEREVQALTTLTVGRLTTLVDVGTLADGRTCLVLEQLTGGSLSGFLEGRSHLLPGEAVTILAPIAAALAELQAIGLIHPAVSLASILFDSSGRPVLTGLGELRALPEAGRGRSEALALVHGRLAQVIRTVLDHVDPVVPVPTVLCDLERWCAVPAAGSAARTWGEVEHLLFAWAEARPVRLGRSPEAVSGPQPAVDWLRRPLSDDFVGCAPTEKVRFAAEDPRAKRMLGSRVSRARTAVGRLWEGHPAGGLKSLLGRRFRLRRGPLLLVALVALLSTGLAVMALAAGGSAHTDGARPEGSSKPAESTTADGDEVGGDGSPREEAVVTGDDPVVALPALLRVRSRCLAEVSVVCLDAVHQAQSAALAADSYTLRMMQQGGEVAEFEDWSSWAAVLVERMGDVALVSLQAPDAERQPASVLVVKGEAGWRIRDIFDYQSRSGLTDDID
ncbi:protein kinase [Cryobacterium sp. TMT1-62]|uniref:protein kinase n=1 Tax=Cryobacterium sp. TMT1-62 TaxID=1259240 RepID=UPI00141AA35B|nr:protein kinase [Cryobacterium sp. TMT1-62]